MDTDRFRKACESIGLTLTDDQLQAFADFEESLYEANKVMNLTRVPREDAWRRHFLDSLLIHDLLPHGASVLDIGAGPGFPSWPLACARPDLKVSALDSNGKMLGFLKSQPLANLKVLSGRAEEFGHRGQFDFVTGRALAPLAIQLELSAAPAKLAVIPMRTGTDREQIETLDVEILGLRLERVSEKSLPVGESRLFPIYRKVGLTPKTFPRRWAEIKAKPIGTNANGADRPR